MMELGKPDRCSPVAVAARKRGHGGLWPCVDQDPDLDRRRCSCDDCRQLDREHPREGYQLKLL
jgi:hypothetical protein